MFRSVLVTDLFFLMRTFAADNGYCYGVLALYKNKIGLLRPEIYLICFPASRLFGF